MSRIYDALRHTADPVVRMIDGEQDANQAGLEFAAPAATAESEIIPLHTVQKAGIEDTGIPPTVFAQDAYSDAIDKRGYRTVRIRARASMPILPYDGSDHRTAESYRILRTNILHHAVRPKVIAVSSAGSGDGKTTSAINLAGVLSLKQDIQTLLVDGDLRHGSIAPMLGIDSSPGLAEVLSGECALKDAIVQTENLPNLHVLPAGRSWTNPAELLDSPAWNELGKVLRERFHFTVVDATPIGIVADYDLVQVICDGTVMVVRPDHTDRNAYTKAIQTIPKGKLLGVLLNCTQDWFLWRVRDYYGYYGQGKKPSEG
jgi:capsular exopolysaccharide synthesis family protein